MKKYSFSEGENAHKIRREILEHDPIGVRHWKNRNSA